MTEPRTIRILKKLQREIAKKLDYPLMRERITPSQAQKVLSQLIDYVENQYGDGSHTVPLDPVDRDPRHVANSARSPALRPTPVCPNCRQPLVRSLFPNPFPDAPILPTFEGEEGDPLPPTS